MSREHPAVLMIYSEESGRYEEAGDEICTARWATSTYGHQAGEICGEIAGYWAGDVGVCAHHRRRAINAMRADAIGRHQSARAEIDAAMTEEWRKRDRAERLERERRSIVYYLYRPSDDMIKIGTTTNWKNRFSDHRREHGGLLLVLAHAGGRDAERKMHLKFARYRPGPSEWFQPGKLLLSWIRRQRASLRAKETSLPPLHGLAETRTLLERLAAKYDGKRLPPGSRRPARPPKPRLPKPPRPLTLPTVPDCGFPRERPSQVYCRTSDAAAHLGLTIWELKRWDASSDGPESFDLGTIAHFKIDDLKPWAESVISKLAADPAA